MTTSSHPSRTSQPVPQAGGGRGRHGSASCRHRQLLRLTTKLSRTYQTIERLQNRIARLLESVPG